MQYFQDHGDKHRRSTIGGSNSRKAKVKELTLEIQINLEIFKICI